MLCDSITCIIPLIIPWFSATLISNFLPWSNSFAFDSPVPWVHSLLLPLRLMISAGLTNKRGCCALWCSASLTNALYPSKGDLKALCKWSHLQACCALPSMGDTFSYQMPVQAAQQDSAQLGRACGWLQAMHHPREDVMSQPEPMEPALALCSHIKHNIIVLEVFKTWGWMWHLGIWFGGAGLTAGSQRCFPTIKILSFHIIKSAAVKEAIWSLRLICSMPISM